MSSFEIEAQSFRRALRSVMTFASDGKIRKHLHSVFIRCVNGRLNVVATDGNVLGVWRRDVLQDGDDFDTLWKICDAKNAADKCRNEGLVTVMPNGISGDGVALTFAPIDDTYPPYTKVVPNVTWEDRVQWIGLGAKYVQKVGSAFCMAADGTSNPSVRATLCGGPIDPVMFESDEASELLVLLMPRRVCSPEEAEDGGKAPEKAAADVRVQSALEAIADANNALVPVYRAIDDTDDPDAKGGMSRARHRLADARRQLAMHRDVQGVKL